MTMTHDDGPPPTDDDAPDAPPKKPRRKMGRKLSLVGGDGEQQEWEGQLDFSDKGARGTIGNAIMVLSLDTRWKGVIAYNAFTGSIIKRSEPPMRANERPVAFELGEWNDVDTSLLCAWLARYAGVRTTPQLAGRAAYAVAQQTAFHPVRDYLESLAWDGTVRCNAFLSRYLGAAQNDYTQAIGAKWLISAVARIYDPGCKADHAVVLEGPQGAGKSTAVEILAGQWFSDTPLTMGDKDSYEALRGVWIYELGELAALRRSDVEAQKAYISKRSDRYRRPYGEGPIEWKRQVVFAGTTNDDRYLIDPTGNRRFWPVTCGAIDLAALRQDRDQLWAEAVVRYKQSEPWHLETNELAKLAMREQSDRVHLDSWETLIGRWLETPRATEMLRRGQGLSIADVLTLAVGMKAESIKKAEETRAGIIMRRLGWSSPRKVSIEGRREYRIFPPLELQQSLGLEPWAGS